MTEKTKIAFIGDGNMTYSIVKGLTNHASDKWDIVVSGHHAAKLHRLQQECGVRIAENNLDCIKEAAVVVLSVKPDVGPIVLEEIGATLGKSRAVLISILGATSIDKLFSESDYNIPTVHCMPNVCSAVNAGVTSMYANKLISDEQKKVVKDIFSDVGYAFWIADDKLTDSVAAVSGSGPAYFFYVIEILQNIAKEFGLPEEAAIQLARYTAKGAADMAVASDEDIIELRKMVTTPGGSTAQAIKTFEAGNMRELFLRALENALNHH